MCAKKSYSTARIQRNNTINTVHFGYIYTDKPRMKIPGINQKKPDQENGFIVKIKSICGEAQATGAGW